MARTWITAALCLVPAGIAAQDGSTARALCDPEDPVNRCQIADCKCVEDVLGIQFERSGGPILEVDDLDLPIEAVVILETESAGVQSWSYGVRHDGREFTIEFAMIDGTVVFYF